MGRTLSYDDAVRKLGGDAAAIQKLADLLVGTGMLVLVGPFRDVLEWFDAKAELSRITERLINGLVERRRSLSRYERTERLRAAHVVLASAAFFEIMAETELPIDHAALRLTLREQAALTEVAAQLGWSAPVPGPAESHEEFRARLADFYRELAGIVIEFGSGLAVWERLDASVLERAAAATIELAEPAVVRFESMLGRLAAEFPEVAFWASVREQTAVHARLRDVRTGLAALGEVLNAIAVGRAPDERRESLARAYAAALGRPVAETGEVPPGLCLPSLGEAFVPPSYRVAEVNGSTPLSNEDWWERQPVRDDLLALLTAQLTSSDMTISPALILGQPGSGKSVLARVLAARLPPNDFLPVLVPLRSVPAAYDVQEQIEQAIRADTGERIEWPALARSAGDALPVIILDGFDELLQATGVSQTDYLLRVAAFQRREADQGRRVAVVVTSRTSVADRARAPEGALAIRLEPFDRPRVAAWLDTWNRTNAEHFASGAAAALDLDTVLRYPELAAQPLLLLMLAIYDAEGNSLRSAGMLRPDQLYERLLQRFAGREVDKRGTGLPTRQRDQLVEAELRKLSVVAFAMFNRGAQWVTEDELDADLRSLPGLAISEATPAASATAGLRAPIQAAELALGSFFFVYRARATQDDDSLSTYEFLHATFGEFLVARLIHQVIRDMIARERATIFVTGTAAEDGLLHALLSFAPLVGRRQVVAFAHGMATDAAAADHADWIDLLVRLFDAAQKPRLPGVFDAYTPRQLTVQARIAAHTSNLLILMLCAGHVTASRLSRDRAVDSDDGRRTVRNWQDLTLLWHSQGGASGWSELLDTVQVDRTRRGGRRDVALSLRLDGVATAPPVDVNWVLGIDRPDDNVDDGTTGIFQDGSIEAVRREAHFTCDSSNDLQQHAIEPLHRAGMTEAGTFVYLPTGRKPVNMLGAYLSLAHDPELPVAEREALYLDAVDGRWGFQHPNEMVLRCLERDSTVSLALVSTVVQKIAESSKDQRTRVALLHCAIEHLDPNRDRAACDRVARSLVDHVLIRDKWTQIHLDVAIRLAELGLATIPLGEEQGLELLAAHQAKRPDFIPRIRILLNVDSPHRLQP